MESVISGPEKAVLFLLSLDEAVASNVVRELNESDLRKLRAVASTMHEVPAGALDETFRDFITRCSQAVAVPRGGLPYLRRLSAGALGEERIRGVFEEGITSPFARLEVAAPEAVGALLSKEPDPIAGAVLARMAPAAAAEVLSTMDPERQISVIAHVSRMAETQADILEDVASAIAEELPSPELSTMVNIDGIAKAAEILNASGKEASRTILLGLENQDGELATEVKQAMFTFDDLGRVDTRAMRELLREVPTDRLTIALKGASEEVSNAIFSGLSSRAADLIRDDLELLVSVKKADVEAARLEVTQAAIRLEGEGRIDLGRGDE